MLLLLAIPALSLEFGNGALRQFPADHETRIGAELAAKELGPGASGPVQVIARFDRGAASDSANRAAARDYAAALARDPEAARVSAPSASRDGRSALFTIAPRGDPESAGSQALVERLREGGGGSRRVASLADVQVGGATASVEDFSDLVAGSMWKIALFVLVLSYFVLFVLLRSLLLPLKAVLMTCSRSARPTGCS